MLFMANIVHLNAVLLTQIAILQGFPCCNGFYGYYGYGQYSGYNMYGGYNTYGTFNNYGTGGYTGYAPGGYSSPFIAVNAIDNGAIASQDPDFVNYQYYTPPTYGDQQPAQPAQPEQQAATCTVHTVCVGAMLCISGQCQPMEPSQKKCSGDGDCPNGGCKGSYCWFPPGTPDPDGAQAPTPAPAAPTPAPAPGAGGPCSKQEDCSATQMCGGDGKCVNGFSIELKCNSDSDCDKKCKCKGGTCWMEGEPGKAKDGDACKEHTECSLKSICEKKKCATAMPSTDKCVMDLMCGSGRVCKYFVCWKSLGVVGNLLG